MSVVIRLPKPSTVVAVVTRIGMADSPSIVRSAVSLSSPCSSRWWYSEIMWTSSVKPMASISEGMIAVRIVSGMPVTAMRPSDQTMLTTAVTTGMTTPWSVRTARKSVTISTTVDSGMIVRWSAFRYCA